MQILAINSQNAKKAKSWKCWSSSTKTQIFGAKGLRM